MVTAAQAVRSAFNDARRHIKIKEAPQELNAETRYYWSVYLSALETVAFRAGESAMAVEITEFRAQLHFSIS
jgi:hypothetical protein